MDDPRIAALLGGPQGNPSQEAIEKAKLMGLHLMGMAQPDVIGNRPDVQGAVTGFAQSAAEPFGQLGRVMTGSSEHWPTDLAGAAAGLAPIGPPGTGKLAKTAIGSALKTAAPEAERILGAAVTGTSGKVFHAPTHLQAMEKMASELGVPMSDIYAHLEPDVGRFLTSHGRMLDRQEAGKLAGLDRNMYGEDVAKQLMGQ